MTAQINRYTSGTISWHKSYSSQGYILTEVQSACIKEMRRGKEYEAVFWAYEMAQSGPEAEAFLWDNLGIFAVEDCGLANPEAMSVVNNARTIYFSIVNSTSVSLKSPMREGKYLALTEAVLYLTRSKKSRYVNELFRDVMNRVKEGSLKPEIPNYALDFHCKKGQEMGRGLKHYLEEASFAVNKDESFSDVYLKEEQKRAEL